MDRSVVIFGASSGGQKVAKELSSMGIDFAFFVDNGQAKWGTEVLGKQVYNPDVLRDGDYAIIIASEAYQEEIEKQLEAMNLLENSCLKEQFIYESLCKNKDEYLAVIDSVEKKKDYKSYLFELNEGYELGGVPSWTYTVAQDLLKRGEAVKVISNVSKDLPEQYCSFTEQMAIQYETYSDNIKLMMKYIVKHLPCRIFASRQHELMWAGILLKQYCNMDIEIVSIIHNDRIAKYRRHKYLAPMLDGIFCVGAVIKQILIEEYFIPKDKVWFKESPVKFEYNNEHKYHDNVDEPLQIGLASRLVVPQKRLDYMIPLVEYLEKKEINYQINIAGEGDYKPKLEQFIQKNNLQDKIILCGRIEHERMGEFYLKNDIFIQLSDFEGCSISMLEAMFFGTVPVITRVSGTEDFIQNGETGYSVPTGDMQMLADKIEILAKDRQRLSKMGAKCIQLVKISCDNEAYLDTLTCDV